MSINFEKNSYLSAVKEKNDFNSNHVKSNLQFAYVDVSIQEFNEKYSGEGWFGRKIIALPAAIWAGAVKTIYHLAKAIIIGFFKAFCDDGKYFQAQLFCVGRDFQESFGWLISLFNDRLGQYHIQESEFHKNCYDYSLAAGTKSNAPSSLSSPMDKPQSGQQRSKPAQQRPSSRGLGVYSTGGPLPFSGSVNPFPSIAPNTPFSNSTTSRPRTVQSQTFYQSPAASSTNSPSPFSAVASQRSAEKDASDSSNRNVDEELKEINKMNTKEKEERLNELANFCFDNISREKALEIIKGIYSNSKIKEEFITKVAVSYYEEDNLDAAFATIKTISYDSKSKESMIVKIAEKHFNNDNLETALTIIKTISYDSDSKESMIAKIAEKHFNNGNLEAALTTIQIILYDSNSKESMIVKIAEKHFNNGNLDAALKIIKTISYDSDSKELIIAKIAEAYIKVDREKALETISKILYDTEMKLLLLTKFIQYCYLNKDDANALKALEIITRRVLIAKIIETNRKEVFAKIIKENHSTNAIKDFFSRVTADCYEQSKEQFIDQSPQIILQYITKMATTQSNIDAFLSLKKNDIIIDAVST